MHCGSCCNLLTQRLLATARYRCQGWNSAAAACVTYHALASRVTHLLQTLHGEALAKHGLLQIVGTLWLQALKGGAYGCCLKTIPDLGGDGLKIDHEKFFNGQLHVFMDIAAKGMRLQGNRATRDKAPG